LNNVQGDQALRFCYAVSRVAFAASFLALTGCVANDGITSTNYATASSFASYIPPDAGTLAAIRTGAERGDAEDQHQLGRYYASMKDYASSLAWLGKSAAQGNAGGENDLGYLYFAGLGVPQNYAIAQSWFTKAADRGYPAAEDNLGYMYSRGLGVPQNAALAVTLLQRAQAQGDANASGILAGLGVGQPPAPAAYSVPSQPTAPPSDDPQNDADDQQQREQQLYYEQQQIQQQKQQQEFWDQQQAQQQQLQQQQEEQYQQQQEEQEQYQQQQDEENNATQEEQQPEGDGSGD
jgi:TPR repeat protein